MIPATSRPLNFLHLTTFYPPYSFGGDAMYIYRLSHTLADLGHHVDVVHCRDSYALLHPSDPEVKFASHPNVSTHGLRSGLGWLSPLITHQTGQPYLKSKAIYGLLASKPYDVIHYHNISLLGPGILKLSCGERQPIKLYTTHDHWLVCPTHVLWKFNRSACDRPQCLRCTLLARRPPQIWRYTRMLENASACVDRFLAPSRFTARLHAERGFPKPMSCLPYFMDRADGDWQNPGLRPQERPYFLFVGRLEVIKGLQSLVDIWKKVPDVDLLVAGSGRYEKSLKSQAASNPRIKFLGPRSQRELAALYFHALACIVPSITYETFGMIIIESFARKTPVIVRNLGALPEVVQESGGGFIYQTDDELLEAMKRIAESPSLREELGEMGYSAFVQRWTREAHMELYFDLLRDLALERFGFVPWALHR